MQRVRDCRIGSLVDAGWSSLLWLPVNMTALELANQKRLLGRLHHMQRIEWLSEENPVFACGTPVSKSDVFNLLQASKQALADGILYNAGPEIESEEAKELLQWAVENGKLLKNEMPCLQI